MIVGKIVGNNAQVMVDESDKWGRLDGQSIRKKGNTMIMDSIVLDKTNEGWFATHGGPLGDQVQELFGTKRIQTAFTSAAEEAQVVMAIMRLNPGVIVSASKAEVSS